LITTEQIMMSDALRAVILGIVEGVTEFLPVSSTGHLLLAERFFDLGEGNFWKSFAVLIQLGAILAIVAIYFFKLWRVALGMFSNPDDRRFVIGLLVAFLPAAVIGAAAGGYIKAFLFNPWVVCFSLIVGGAILLWVDQLDLKPHQHDAMTFPLPMYLTIGFAQCLAMIPGVSRSGASIVAAMLLGADKRAAAEFSFYLAIPTMVGAFAYDLYKNRADMTADHAGIIAIGFAVSFVTAIIVVKTFLTYVTRHGFTLFAWWRVIVGTLGLVALAMGK
jgi:undecaprenyl-diphosphatase